MVYKKLDEFPQKKSCNFCSSRRSDEIELGEVANISDIYCHYFCLLLSNNVVQRGKDNQGILGFMPSDIKKEIARGKKLTCDYCKKRGATIECSDKKCKTKFHLTCGLKKGSLHQFFGHFRSYCLIHRPVQQIPRQVMDSARNCVVCLCPLQRTNSSIWPECCKPSALIHRRCLQRMAMYHGYYFKCPLCNDTSKFLDEAKRLGIYIPEQDPTWEREEGAFQELLDRTITCELGSNCLCDNGPSYSRIATKWKLERCNMCGSSGVHLGCSTQWMPGSGFHMSWTCETCSSAESAAQTAPVIDTNSESEVDEEMEVDVETIDHDPPLLLPELYFRPHETMHLASQLDPYVSLERRGSLDCLKTELPIIVSDSDDDFEVLSISSTEDSAAPPPMPCILLNSVNPATAMSVHRPLLRSGNGPAPMPRPLQRRANPAAKRKWHTRDTPLQRFAVGKRKTINKDQTNKKTSRRRGRRSNHIKSHVFPVEGSNSLWK